MVRNGKQGGVYLQNELKDRIDSLIQKHKDSYKSRNHFINCAIILKLKECENNVLYEGKRESEKRDNGSFKFGKGSKHEENVG